MWGLSLHYYTVDWSNKGSATEFDEKAYFDVLERCLKIPPVLDKHLTIMDKYDPEKKVAAHISGMVVYFPETTMLDISSTGLRKDIAEGRPVRYLVPPAVESFIEEKGLYREP